MDMKNSRKIEDSVRMTLAHIRENVRGKMAEIASATGISKSQLSKYASGSTKSLPSEYLEKLTPYIEEYSIYTQHPADDASPAKKQSQGQKIMDEVVLRTCSPGQQIITGVINVYGVPNEKIIEAIRTTDLSDRQRDELRRKIFS